MVFPHILYNVTEKPLAWAGISFRLDSIFSRFIVKLFVFIGAKSIDRSCQVLYNETVVFCVPGETVL